MDILKQPEKGERKARKVECRRSGFPRIMPPFWHEYNTPNHLRMFMKGNVTVLLSEELYGQWYTT